MHHNNALPFSSKDVLVDVKELYPTFEDEELMEEYKRGNMRAFEELYNRWERPIYFYIRLRNGVANITDDLFQEVFLRLHRARFVYDSSRPFKNWIFTIARNVLINEQKRFKARIRLNENFRIKSLNELSFAQDIEESFNNEQGNIELARKMLASLPESQQEVIILNKLEGLKCSEIAKVMESTEAAVKQRIYRGMKTLRGSLKRFHKDFPEVESEAV